MAEFTGERVIPGEVDTDLLNEHLARYAFAARLAAGRRVLDAGCGSGYGAAELARSAESVLGIDIAQDAIGYAREHYHAPNLRFERASCLEIPAPAGSFALVVAFELIEHLDAWRAFLEEMRRVLAPDGQFVVSTPNTMYYAEARAEQGPNPFHVHEFTYGEFQSVLKAVFPTVTMYLENHADAMVFTPAEEARTVHAAVEQGGASPEEAHFFVAICSVAGDTAVPGLAYVPRAANMLRERERHIEILEARLKERIERVVQLQDEFVKEQATSRARIDQLEAESREATAVATRLAGELDAKCQELAHCVDCLHAAERTVDERTAWAKRNQAEAEELHRQLRTIWVRLGFKLRLLDRPGTSK